MTNQNTQNLSGSYICSGFDKHDGYFTGSRLVVTLNSENSDFEHGFAVYHCEVFSEEGIKTYVGSIIANGNNFAMSFRNVTPGEESDHGVLFGVATHDCDAQGKVRTVLHNAYYQPEYKGGGYGSATCVRD